VHINGPTVHDEAQMPSAREASGYGRFGGKAAVNEFTELRWLTIQTTPALPFSGYTPAAPPRLSAPRAQSSTRWKQIAFERLAVRNRRVERSNHRDRRADTRSLLGNLAAITAAATNDAAPDPPEQVVPFLYRLHDRIGVEWRESARITPPR